ncbi:phage tail tip lysozyme [Brucella sp. C7-11G]
MAKPALNNNAHYAYRYYIDKHKLAPHMAAGIVGNLMQESTFNTGARNPGDGRDGSDSIGIGQWNGDRAKALRRYAGDNLNNLDTQLDFVVHEMREGPERGVWNKLQASRNVDEATAAMISYERPQGWSAKNPRGGHGWDNRYSWAQEVHGVNPQDISRNVTAQYGSTQSPDFGERVEPAQQQVSQPTAQDAQQGPNTPEGWTAPDERSFGKRVFDRVLGTETEAQAKAPVIGSLLPKSFMGIDTKKGINLLGSMSKAFGESDEQSNKQVQASAQQAQGRRAQAQPVQVSMMSSLSNGPSKQDMNQALSQVRNNGQNEQAKDIASLLLGLNNTNDPNAIQDLMKRKKSGWGGSFGHWGA